MDFVSLSEIFKEKSVIEKRVNEVIHSLHLFLVLNLRRIKSIQCTILKFLAGRFYRFMFSQYSELIFL